MPDHIRSRSWVSLPLALANGQNGRKDKSFSSFLFANYMDEDSTELLLLPILPQVFGLVESGFARSLSKDRLVTAVQLSCNELLSDRVFLLPFLLFLSRAFSRSDPEELNSTRQIIRLLGSAADSCCPLARSRSTVKRRKMVRDIVRRRLVTRAEIAAVAALAAVAENCCVRVDLVCLCVHA